MILFEDSHSKQTRQRPEKRQDEGKSGVLRLLWIWRLPRAPFVLLSVVGVFNIVCMVSSLWNGTDPASYVFLRARVYRSSVPHQSRAFPSIDELPSFYQDHQRHKDDRRKIKKKKKKEDPDILTDSFFYHGTRVRHVYLESRITNSIDSGCEYTQSWHSQNYPTCNSAHEYDFASGILKKSQSSYKNSLDISYLFHGRTRDAWAIRPRPQYSATDDTTTVVMKTIQFGKDFDEIMEEHQRMDSIVTGQLTSSEHVVNIFGYCGDVTINEYAEQGDLDQYVTRQGGVDKISSTERLKFAREAAVGLADIHTIDGANQPASVVHHDLKPPNMLIINGTLKYHDFNNAQLLKRNDKRNKTCGFTYGDVCGGDPDTEEKHTNPRAPEECRVQKAGVRNRSVFTEKVEVYRLGVFFYFLLTGEYPFRHEHEGIRSPRTVKKWLLEGRIPALPQHIEQSDDVTLQALVNVTRQAMSVDSEIRPSARELADYLNVLSKNII